MKTGILTLPLHTNYGGILQAYALQTAIEKLGHAAEHILTYMPPGIAPWHQGMTVDEVKFMQQHTDRFIAQYIHCGKNNVDLVRPTDYDAIVVGSDQVWRYFFATGMCGGFDKAFLSFTTGWNIKRIAYAPSFGLDTWEAPQDQIPVISSLLKKFDAVSVRELTGVQLCEEVLGVQAEHVVDPTLLLTRDDYERLIAMADTVEPEGNLMCYVLDETAEKTELIDTVASRFSLTPFRTNSKVEQTGAPLEERVQPPLEQWLRSFRDAKMVITDSFHASVFSILFGKPFIVTGNPGRGIARLQSLLAMLGLEEHLVFNAGELDKHSDYSITPTAYDHLASARQTSIDFLKQAFK